MCGTWGICGVYMEYRVEVAPLVYGAYCAWLQTIGPRRMPNSLWLSVTYPDNYIDLQAKLCERAMARIMEQYYY